MYIFNLKIGKKLIFNFFIPLKKIIGANNRGVRPIKGSQLPKNQPKGRI
jgi:hypothetical protein